MYRSTGIIHVDFTSVPPIGAYFAVQREDADAIRLAVWAINRENTKVSKPKTSLLD